MREINDIQIELHPAAYPASAADVQALRQTGTYARCRIPGVLALENGEALLYYECRTGNSDWGAIDIGCRRVTADGKIETRTILADGHGKTMNNPVMIADGKTVHFLFCEDYKRVFYRRSADLGATWTAAREITAGIARGLDGTFWNAFAVGPGHGLRLPGGRLLASCWFACSRSDPYAHRPSFISTVYSDDGGESWQLGEILDTAGIVNPSESCIAALNNGRLLLNIRNENPDKRRRVAVSDDGVRWRDLQAAPELPDPVCCAGLCSMEEDLLFTNCAHTQNRTNLTLKRLSPDGKIKEKLYLSHSGGYSDVCMLPDGRVYVFYEKDKDLYLAVIAPGGAQSPALRV